MNQSQFNISIKNSIELISKFNIYKSKGPKGNGIYSEAFLGVSKKNNIIDTYKCAIENFDYDIILTDDSILQFQFKGGELRYAFIQNPYKFFTREEYFATIYPPEDLLQLEQSDIDDMINDINDIDYEQFLNEQSLNSISNYFRYDCSKAGYLPLVHSYSHIHIGLNENIRIPTSKILTPLKFTKFCIKNTYYTNWKAQFETDENFEKEIESIKKDCLPLPIDKWTDKESNELFLS